MNASVAKIAHAVQPEILDFFPLLDALLKNAVARARQVYYANEQDESFHGLYISEQEVDGMLAHKEMIGSGEAADEFVGNCMSLPGIEGLSRYWQLSSFDHAVILLALAPELDLRYERIYGYLQDDVTRRKASVDLALNVLTGDAGARIAQRQRFLADAPLLKSGLLSLIPDSNQVEPPLLTHSLKLDEHVVRLLLGGSDPDPRLASFCEFIPRVSPVSFGTDLLQQLSQFISSLRRKGRAARLLFAGPGAAAKASAAEAVASALEVPLLNVHLARHPSWRSEPAILARQLAREASRTSAVLHLDGLESGADVAAFQTLITGLAQYEGTVTVASSSPEAAAALAQAQFLAVTFPMPDYKARCALWGSELASAGIVAGESTVSILANHFVCDGEQIRAAVEAAAQLLEWQAASTRASAPNEAAPALMSAARAQSGTELAALTMKLRPVYRWQDIVLPQDSVELLREMCQRIRHGQEVLERGGFGKKLSAGKGVAALFAGPAGTGKTMAAEVIANELGLDLFRIDLSTVVSKYIGETEKNLERIFHAATSSNSILLFDEADALCGRRSEVRDAHDRYANIEISYLLQKMEQYEGITILTTNLRGNLDEAFVRRLAFTVHFPFPEESDRLQIWKRIFPEETPVDPELDFGALAKHFRMNGGNIKNVALAAAFLAAAESRPVHMSDILHATRREYEKVGKVLSTAEIEAVVQ